MADRVKKSKGGFSVLLDWGRKAKRGGGGLQPSVWGTEIYVAVKPGYSLLYGGSSSTPASQPILHTLNYSDIYSDRKTQRFFTASDYFHSQVLPSYSLPLCPPPFQSSLPYNNRDTGSPFSKVKYIIDFLSLARFSLHLSTSSHLSSSTSSYCLWGDWLSTSLTSPCYVCLTSSLHAWIRPRVSPLPIKLSGDPLKPHSGYRGLLSFFPSYFQSGPVPFFPDCQKENVKTKKKFDVQLFLEFLHHLSESVWEKLS